MIKVDPCRGCGRLLYSASLGGLTYRAETDPLDAQQALTALVGGATLYRVTSTSVTSVTPVVLEALRLRGTVEGPTVVRRHVCTVKASEAVSRPSSPSGVPADPKGLPSSPAGRQTPSLGQSTECSTPGSAKSAETPGSDTGPRCDDCGLIMQEGEYVAAQLGEIYIWAAHLANCPT